MLWMPFLEEMDGHLDSTWVEDGGVGHGQMFTA